LHSAKFLIHAKALAVFVLDCILGAQIDLIEEKTVNQNLTDIGLLILRIGAGGFMLVAHGWGKFMNYFDTSFNSVAWADPIGIGPAMSHHLATGAEVGCSVLLILGVLTRLSAIPLAVTMGVAAFVVHADDPFKVKELALVYFIMFLTLVLTGGGRFSLLKSKTVVLS